MWLEKWGGVRPEALPEIWGVQIWDHKFQLIVNFVLISNRNSKMPAQKIAQNGILFRGVTRVTPPLFEQLLTTIWRAFWQRVVSLPCSADHSGEKAQKAGSELGQKWPEKWGGVRPELFDLSLWDLKKKI